MILRRLFLLAAVTAAAATAGRAQAQGPVAGGCGYGYGGYWGWDIGRLYSVLAENVPYYAAFPPVYYSYPVPRSYGYSPFAYPPGVMTPEVQVAEPVAITNPFFRGRSEAATVDEAAKAPIDRSTAAPAPKPLEIINPYVRSGGPALATR
jgi:hypothetical protein